METRIDGPNLVWINRTVGTPRVRSPRSLSRGGTKPNIEPLHCPDEVKRPWWQFDSRFFPFVTTSSLTTLFQLLPLTTRLSTMIATMRTLSLTALCQAFLILIVATRVSAGPLSVQRRNALDVWSPSIDQPTANSIWTAGSQETVIWYVKLLWIPFRIIKYWCIWCALFYGFQRGDTFWLWYSRDVDNAPKSISNQGDVVLKNSM